MIQKNFYDKLIAITLANNKKFKVRYNVRDVNTTTDSIIITKYKIKEEDNSYGKYIDNEYLMIELPKRKNVIYDSDVEENVGEEMGTSLHIFCNTKGICDIVGDIGIAYNNLDNIYNLIEQVFKGKIEEYHPHYEIDNKNEFTTEHNFKKEFQNKEDIENIKKYGETRIHFMTLNKSINETYNIINTLSNY